MTQTVQDRTVGNLVTEARKFSGLAVDTLVELTKDNYAPSTRYVAATALLDRGYGRPAARGRAAAPRHEDFSPPRDKLGDDRAHGADRTRPISLFAPKIAGSRRIYL